MTSKRWLAPATVGAAGVGALLLVQVLQPVVWPGSPFAAGAPTRVVAQMVPAPPRLSSHERAHLQHVLDEVVTEGSSGAVAQLVETGKGGSDSWTGVAGVADRSTGAPVDPDAHFRIASLSKPFVAATLLQLVGEGRAELDDTVEQHLPGLVDGGAQITLEMLLSHTSGLFSYNRAMPPVVEDPLRRWEPAELVEIAEEQGPVFEPGTDVAYSNINYVLAALVIESVTGRPYAQEVRERIIEPLGLTGTSIPEGPEMPEPVLRAYLAIRPAPGAPPEPVGITEFDPSRWYGTAQIVSTVTDVNRFYTALFEGEVLDEGMLTEMLKVRATDEQGVGYGLGPRRQTLSCGVRVWMHSGNISGYRTWTVHTADRHVTLFQARFAEDPDPPAWKLIEAALCPSERSATAPPDGGRSPEPTPVPRPSEPSPEGGYDLPPPRREYELDS
ncbi:D-alanyl-D-alanine carboxypeptidase [Marinactinospora thermotolerans DSM 45154]|uniref:D-alanyl-D-alanine carboxypeptidase n=1 Tax=Marinactinospora thermotolerans DSM 45154 TaxID=1122192 RepID=A0A1T4Q9Y4_9ACTN|nr:serine hydrolase domain-containing protein [Marinactinospora thermotolerans]SKA00467.1 D-alanyl-D-alanine carboxypeptidase [Marinactinospora thermotolerans DSM 45154]